MIMRSFRSITLWLPERVEEALIEAAETLKRLPKVHLKSRLTYWPEVVRSSAELFMGEQFARNRLPALPDAIDRMDEALVWLLSLNMEQRRIVWARACNIPWRRLEDIDGRSHVTLRKIYTEALLTIAKQLNGIGVVKGEQKVVRL
jgi:hypothetical protein